MMRTATGIKFPKIHENLTKCLHYGTILCAVFILAVSASVAEAATFTVSNLNDSGAGSLRQAITDANATTAADIINFSIAGTFTPATSLPTITNPVTINGYSAPGAVANTGAAGFVGTLVVEISGANVGGAGIGLRISASNCNISGLAINRFEDSGIRIDTGTNNTVTGSFIGTNLAGTASLGNFNRGILIVGSTGNAIGAASAAGTNVISGNFGTGISITGGGSATVRRNFIGTDKTGTAVLANTQEGIRIADSSGSTIGGANANSRNVISGNGGSGISIVQSSNTPSATGNVIAANFIGVNITGTATAQTTPVGNSGSGVLINAAGNTVGGNRTASATASTCSNSCNVISGNRANGVSLGSNFASQNIITGNNIGIGADNTTGIGNRDNGVQISNLAANNIIGGTTTGVGFCNNTCNLIANNGDAVSSTSAKAAVYVDLTAGSGNAIRENSFYSNAGIGIDLGAVGTTANDSNDPDTGANNLQNFPIITSAETNGLITGSLNSTPNTTFAIDFYSNNAADAANSQGRTFIGSTPVTTDGSGNATFSYGTPAIITAGQIVTATATTTGGSAQTVGDTSEFSANRVVVTSTTGAQGLEADVATRPNGDGAIASNDVVQVTRFVNELDTPSTTPNEFQRGDSAPRNSGGDGTINSSDIVQTIRYLNELDVNQSASGPTVPNGGKAVAVADSIVSGKSAKSVDSKQLGKVSSPQVAPELRVESTSGSAGNQVSVNIRVDATGNEAQYAFAVLVDPNVLTFAGFAAGGTTSQTFSCNGTATAGRVRCSIGAFTGNQAGSNTNTIGEIAPGNNQILIKVNFTVAANAQANSTTAVNLGSQSASDDSANSITPAVTNGTVTIAGATAAGAAISGRVLTASGRGVANAVVNLTDQTGTERTARTNGFGYYRFTEVETGASYTLGVRAKGSRYETKAITVRQDLDDLDFIPVP